MHLTPPRHPVSKLNVCFLIINISIYLSSCPPPHHQQVPDVQEVEACVSSPSPPPSMSLLSPRATQSAGCIRLCEEQHRAKAKVGHTRMLHTTCNVLHAAYYTLRTMRYILCATYYARHATLYMLHTTCATHYTLDEK